jgi:hypothetical protein
LLGILIVLDGTRALLPAHAAGVLSMTVDTDGMPPDRAYAIYTRGRFSFRAVTSANPGMVFDELSIAGLKGPRNRFRSRLQWRAREMDQSALVGS